MVNFSKAFSKIVAKTMDFEGGDRISNDPDDPGGLTKYGISRAAHPSVDVAALTEEEAKVIYFAEYWTTARCNELPEPLSQALFDFAVNAGPARAVFALQTVLKLLGADIKEDGWIGQRTIEAAWTVGAMDAARMLQAARGGYYLGLRAAAPKNKKYLGGWLARVHSLARFLGLTPGQGDDHAG